MAATKFATTPAASFLVLAQDHVIKALPQIAKHTQSVTDRVTDGAISDTRNKVVSLDGFQLYPMLDLEGARIVLRMSITIHFSSNPCPVPKSGVA